MEITFYKYQGTGNDFVIIDNRNGGVHLNTNDIKQLCHRRFGIGADGFMLLNASAHYDFEMKYYNADGREGSMCGNGGRCIVKFAADMGIIKSEYSFTASDGPHKARFDKQGWVQLQMKDVADVSKNHEDFILDTGSPHYVRLVHDVMQYNVVKEGKAVRYNNQFQEHGINVNFVEQMPDSIVVRTYERGVEDETYSCGTGVTASALVSAVPGFNRINVQTLGGKLAVELNKTNQGYFNNIWLCGPATFVFKGTVQVNMQS